jgi:seryl-tRNA synthetase
MAIGGLFLNKTISFPVKGGDNVEKLVAVSRCYRAESSRGQAEKGIYRVHHFTKVEMFAITPPDIGISDRVIFQVPLFVIFTIQ